VRGDIDLPVEVTIAVRCRAGLEALLADELGAAGLAPADIARGVVRVVTRAALGRFHAARLWLTIGVERPLAAGADLPARIAATLAGARDLLVALTEGPVRWRLDFAGGGHRRAVVWQAAQAVRAVAPELINDPTATTWDVVVAEDDATLELRPRRLDDPRFAWRVADVSAASHPTVAAALARVAGRRDGDVVWDPFCGSGAELIERARLGGVARLFGSDLDSRALDAARQNLAAAGVEAELALADALVHHPPAVTLILTNPPLGRRIRGDVGGLLERFAVHAARVLEPGGRLVWITPAMARTERAARRAGLRLEDRRTVDLGGYDAHLERWVH
jgi:23S rRNA G2445 N2-methylase RlmL